VQKGQSSLFLGGLYALTTAALLATQAPLSFLAAKQLSVRAFQNGAEATAWANRDQDNTTGIFQQA
jgi:hypothetical protein